MHTSGLRKKRVASIHKFGQATERPEEVTDEEIREHIADEEVSEDEIIDHEVTDPEQEVTDPNADKGLGMEKIIKSIPWLVEKIKGALSIYSKTENVKLALKESKEAVEGATETVEKMGGVLLNAFGYFAKTGLRAFNKCVDDGSVDAVVKADFTHAIQEVESLAHELDELLGVSKAVVMVMNTVREIANDTTQLIDEVLNFDLDPYILPLENHVSEAIKVFEGFVSTMKVQCETAREKLDRFVKEDIAKGKEYALEKVQELFGDVTPFLKHFDVIYHSTVKPLIKKLVASMKAAYEAANRLNVPLDAPESVTNETIYSGACSFWQTRWFRSIEEKNVDIEKTMTCTSLSMEGSFREKVLGRWYSCRCIGKNDCYVADKHRPAGSRRCFKSVVF